MLSFMVRLPLAILLVCSMSRGYPDTFNYDVTDLDQSSFGPSDWDQIQCEDVATCVREVDQCCNLVLTFP